MSQIDDMPGSKITNAPEKDSFAVSLYTFGIKEETGRLQMGARKQDGREGFP